MTKGKAAVVGSVFQELIDPGVYKRSQGRFTRQVTFFTLAVVVVLGALSLRNTLMAHFSGPFVVHGIPGILLLGGFWLSYRVVNLTRFADFLIAVEAEINKVTWPTRSELVRSSMVVILVIFSLAALLFVYDLVWQALFERIDVLKTDL